MNTPNIVGIVNLTEDSFSDGGKFLTPEAAIAHSEALLDSGADILDLGAASSNPQAAFVPAEVEVKRLEPVVTHLQQKRARISIDTSKPEVQRWALSQQVEFLNDVRGFPDESLYPDLSTSSTKLIVMHNASELDKAVRTNRSVEDAFASIKSFFTARLPALQRAGIARERIIIDPGMGFFLSENPKPSLAVLAHLSDLKEEFGFPIMIGVSRKSFLRNAFNLEHVNLAARSLAAEIFASTQGVDYIRTHDAGQLREGLGTLDAIGNMVKSRS